TRHPTSPQSALQAPDDIRWPPRPFPPVGARVGLPRVIFLPLGRPPVRVTCLQFSAPPPRLAPLRDGQKWFSAGEPMNPHPLRLVLLGGISDRCVGGFQEANR